MRLRAGVAALALLVLVGLGAWRHHAVNAEQRRYDVLVRMEYQLCLIPPDHDLRQCLANFTQDMSHRPPTRFLW